MYHFWIFDPSGTLRGSLKGDYFLDQLRIGRLFGDDTEIFAIETQSPHAYTVTTSLLLLPVADGAKVLLTENAQLNTFQSGSESGGPGVLLNVETYDGIHSETKGWKPRFWRWNPVQKTLTPEAPLRSQEQHVPDGGRRSVSACGPHEEVNPGRIPRAATAPIRARRIS
jgi:hypothetical protein